MGKLNGHQPSHQIIGVVRQIIDLISVPRYSCRSTVISVEQNKSITNVGPDLVLIFLHEPT